MRCPSSTPRWRTTSSSRRRPGAIGRGDAFVLTIANKAGASILSNDSFQEFHGDYPWLFDEGRLVGGKPVPHVGWVFVPRAPVRGPISRRAVRDAGRPRASVASRTHGRPSKLASEPMPVPKAPPPGGRGRGRKKADADAGVSGPAPGVAVPAGVRHAPVNDLLPFLGFVEEHPIGSSVQATTESYSSHGAYVTMDGVRGYVPLRYLGDPAPRSAREVLAMGETATFVVVSFNALAPWHRSGQARVRPAVGGRRARRRRGRAQPHRRRRRRPPSGPARRPPRPWCRSRWWCRSPRRRRRR